MKQISIPLDGRHTNRLQPFMAVSGTDSYEEIYAKFKNFHDMGIYSAVLQYSSDSNAAGMPLSKFDDTYFDTLRRMSRACHALDMTYWVQDAAPFPTGAADGRFMEEPWARHAKVYLIERHTLVEGPVNNAVFLADKMASLIRADDLFSGGMMMPGGPQYPNELIGITALRLCPSDDGFPRLDGDSAIDLTNCYHAEDGTLVFSLPEGHWRIFFLYLSYTGGRKGYMNLLDAESMKIQIEAVHELHYQQMKDELGKTWEGFFYDEPEIGNSQNYNFRNLPGEHPYATPGAMPWSREMPERMRERLGEDWLSCMPALWYDCGPRSRVTRFHFMDVVTRLVQENYNGLMLPWCRERGIRYIGHVLEDEGSHARLGCGPGHYFREQKHQDMAGIDLVGGQLMPGMDVKGTSWYSTTDGDGEFYHYGIGKLASSAAHINPDKQGQSMCEINAVYGDITNAKLFKYLMDHLFVDGINNLVPVSTDKLPIDEGRQIFDYANRMCLLMHHSTHVAPVAMLYHAESEWSGDAQMFQRPGKILATHQIDFDVIPGDVFTDRADYGTSMANGTLSIHCEQYSAIVIPRSRYLRRDVLESLREASNAGIRVLFVDALPEGCCEDLDPIVWGDWKPACVALAELPAQLADLAELRCTAPAHTLKYHHFRKDGLDYILLMNIGSHETIDTTLCLSLSGEIRVYDTVADQMCDIPCSASENGISIPLHLGQYESKLLVVDPSAQFRPVDVPVCTPVETDWTVSFANGMAPRQLDTLCDLGAMPELRRYADPLTYTATLNLRHSQKRLQLDLGRVCDSARVTLNGIDLGLRTAAPYVFDLSDAVREGENHISIDVLPNPSRHPGPQSANMFAGMMESISATIYSVMQPVGLLGPVTIR